MSCIGEETSGIGEHAYEIREHSHICQRGHLFYHSGFVVIEPPRRAMLQFAHGGSILEAADHGVDDRVVIRIQGVQDRLGQFIRDGECIEEAHKLVGRRVATDAVEAGVGASLVKHAAVVVAAAAVMQLHHPAQPMVFPSQE